MSSENDLMEVAKQDPLTAARLCQNEIQLHEKGVQDRLHYFIAVGFAIGHTLARSYKEWQLFKRSSFWDFRTKRLKDKDQQYAYLHAMVFVFAATNKQLYDRAWKYAVAVEPFWEKGSKPEEVLAALRDIGVEELLKRSSEVRKQRKEERQRKWGDALDEYLSDLFEKPTKKREPSTGKPVAKDSSGSTRDKPKDDSSSEPSGDPDPENPAPKEAGGGEERPRKAKSLRLSASRKLRNRVKHLAPGEKARLTVQRVEGKSAAAIRAVGFKKLVP